MIGNYLGRHTYSGSGNNLDVTTWHKPFGEIIAEATAAGFTLDTLLEPKPLEKMKGVSPNNFEKLSKIPFFVVFRLLKQ